MNRKEAKEAMERCEAARQTWEHYGKRGHMGDILSQEAALEMLERAMAGIAAKAVECYQVEGFTSCLTCDEYSDSCVAAALLREWEGEGE